MEQKEAKGTKGEKAVRVEDCRFLGSGGFFRGRSWLRFRETAEDVTPANVADDYLAFRFGAADT